MTGRFLHGDQRYQKSPAVSSRRPRASRLPRHLNTHGPITNRLTTITNFQYRRLNETGRLLFA